jgi:hypothetical protein
MKFDKVLGTSFEKTNSFFGACIKELEVSCTLGKHHLELGRKNAVNPFSLEVELCTFITIQWICRCGCRETLWKEVSILLLPLGGHQTDSKQEVRMPQPLLSKWLSHISPPVHFPLTFGCTTTLRTDCPFLHCTTTTVLTSDDEAPPARAGPAVAERQVGRLPLCSWMPMTRESSSPTSPGRQKGGGGAEHNSAERGSSPHWKSKT